jgi:hypothetical protein
MAKTNQDESLIGKTVKDVEAHCITSGLTARLVEEDGVGFIGTCDYDISRLNLTVEKGVVTKISRG